MFLAAESDRRGTFHRTIHHDLKHLLLTDKLLQLLSVQCRVCVSSSSYSSWVRKVYEIGKYKKVCKTIRDKGRQESRCHYFGEEAVAGVSGEFSHLGAKIQATFAGPSKTP